MLDHINHTIMQLIRHKEKHVLEVEPIDPERAQSDIALKFNKIQSAYAVLVNQTTTFVRSFPMGLRTI